MRIMALALSLLCILSACIPSAETPTILPLDNAIQTAAAGTAAAGGIANPASIPPNYTLPMGSKAILLCSSCNQTGNILSLWQTPDEVTSVGNVPNNTEVVVMEEMNRPDGKPFYKVKAGNVEGWIVKDMVFALDDPMRTVVAAPQATSLKVGSAAIVIYDDRLGNIKLWQTPDELSAVTEIATNTPVTILEEMTTSEGKTYFKVRAGDKEGWLAKDLLIPQ